MSRFYLFLTSLFLSFQLLASHVMGGAITYVHLGGNTYQFELTFYRDCNGADVNPVSENLRVWNHPSLSNIPVLFVSRTDLSPSCNAVAGGPGPLLCGTGNNGGNGIGAIEKVIYRSAPVALSGTPPAAGWAFTYENFSRSSAISNLSNPGTYGMTLAAKIYHLDSPDSSPAFTQDPLFVSCAGTPYQYNGAVQDPDLDSLAFSFSQPMNYFPTGAYNPPSNPAPIPYEPGFSLNSPTPGTSISPSNTPSVLDPASGAFSFNSYTVGNFAIKMSVKAYRAGVLISETEREMQLVVQPCSSSNFPPIIAPPFAAGTSYELTVNAGDLVDFDVLATDLDLQFNGASQNVTLSASYSCAIAPCPTLSTVLPTTAPTLASTHVQWQTSCDHVQDPQGNALPVKTYYFIFKAQDDVCPIPQSSYVTIAIHVLNPGIIAAPHINCIQTSNADEPIINWSVPVNPMGTFVEYRIYSIQNGLLGTITDINSSSFTCPSTASNLDYYLVVVSGCNGTALRSSDTVQNIHLNLNNPNDGTAVLTWNKPKAIQDPAYNGYYYIYREYPTNFFNFLDSVAYNHTSYIDTIDLCHEFIRYRVNLKTTTCNFNSNRPGDNLTDMMTPYIPVLYNVGFDTSTQNMSIHWNQNAAPDTYGYVVYTFDANGFIVELDTVYGANTTTYSYAVPLLGGPYTYTVAAFDSCFTSNNPPTFQTSAKAEMHTSIEANYSIDMCPQTALLSWTTYGGQQINGYEVWMKHNNQWQMLTNTTDTFALIHLQKNESYCLYVKANLGNGYSSFSNPMCFVMPQPNPPAFHYFRVASVDDDNILLKAWVDQSVGVTKVIFERKDTNGVFQEIGQAALVNNLASFLDEEVKVTERSWTYRTIYIDSCGNPGSYANENSTIFVEGSADQYTMINTITWTPYTQFDGPIVSYVAYRNTYGTWESTPFASFPDGTYQLTDDVSSMRNKGEVCYRIVAIEGQNQYGFADSSISMSACIPYEPLIFVPNAFTPDGLNPVFLPVIQNVDPDKYTFTIIDRWGQSVFETHDPAQGWDGIITRSGLPATNDVFEYRIEIMLNKTDAIIKQGYVTLIR
jgi:hypothetical protein